MTLLATQALTKRYNGGVTALDDLTVSVRPGIVGLVGAKRGRLADLVEQAIVVDDTHYGRVEDVQMTIYHLICYAFMEKQPA